MILKKLQFLLLPVIFTSCLKTPDEEVYFLSEIYFPEIKYKTGQLDSVYRSEFWINIIDFGNQEDYDAGFIDFARHIPLERLVDSSGYLVNQGKVITANYDDQWPFIVYSSSNDTIAFHIAHLIQALGYSRVYFYEGGPDDWQEHGAALNLTYKGFMDWYNTHHPFTDTLQFLVDVQPESWYNGSGPLEGHIPGAINIPAGTVADTLDNELVLVDDGKALTDTIPYDISKIVVYSSRECLSKEHAFLEAAQQLGYNQLYRFPSGYETWKEKGNAFEN